MLSPTSAQQLRNAGLAWEPAELDFFVLPMAGFDNQVFVITNMTIMAEPVRGQLSITFHGTVEWALDHVLAADALWLPREDQLREMLEDHLIGEAQPALTLSTTQLGHRCDIRVDDQVLSFEGFDAAEAYAAALLHLLRPHPAG